MIKPMKNKKTQTPMGKLTAGYEQFIRSKELKEGGKKLFDNAIKKAAKPKGRSAK